MTAPRATKEAALSRELADFLVEFSIVLHKRSMYPVGHPHLRSSADRFVRRLETLLEGRDSLQLGVAHRQLIIEGAATDPNNALLRDLSHRLHRHRIAAVRFRPGISLNDVDDVLAALAADPVRQGALGTRPELLGRSPHVDLLPVAYDRLTFQPAGFESLPDTQPTADSQHLWVSLAQLALGPQGTDDGAIDDDPLVLAEAVNRQSGETSYDRVVLDYLSQLAEEMSGRVSPGEERLRRRVSKMIGALEPAALQRLLEAGADHAERRKFTLSSSALLAVDAVVEVVEAAAAASHQSVSHNLLRLLHKLAHHAEHGDGVASMEADGALRKNVARLVANWELDDPNPNSYTAALDAMGRSSAAGSPGDEPECDPEVLLQTALELGVVGPRTGAAALAVADSGRLREVAAMLAAAPDQEVADTLWAGLATTERLLGELNRAPLDVATLDVLVPRMGLGALGPLLDALARADRRSTRAVLLRLLAERGAPAATWAVYRLPGASWFVARNLLVLLRRIGELPSGFSPDVWATHPHPQVRAEALRLMLASPRSRDQALLIGILDRDERILTLVLTAALERCPAPVLAQVKRIVEETGRSADVRAQALRVLGRWLPPERLEQMLGLTPMRRRWLGGRLGGRTSDLVAAVSALATYWGADPRAAGLLDWALRHTDPDVRAAAALKP